MIQAELAAASGLSEATIRHVEPQEDRGMSVKSVRKLAEVFGMPFDDFRRCVEVVQRDK
jgi:transcriptional regulator with XRE-family HTH domain